MFTQEKNDQLADAYVSARLAQARMERAKAELDQHKAILATAGSGKHTVQVPAGQTVTFTVSENNTYSDERMVTALKPGQFQRASTRKLDRQKVKALYPRIYAASKTFVGFKVSL